MSREICGIFQSQGVLQLNDIFWTGGHNDAWEPVGAEDLAQETIDYFLHLKTMRHTQDTMLSEAVYEPLEIVIDISAVKILSVEIQGRDQKTLYSYSFDLKRTIGGEDSYFEGVFIAYWDQWLYEDDPAKGSLSLAEIYKKDELKRRLHTDGASMMQTMFMGAKVDMSLRLAKDLFQFVATLYPDSKNPAVDMLLISNPDSGFNRSLRLDF